MHSVIDKNKALEVLKGAQKVLLAPSSPVDGDSIGSALALMLILKKMGKEARVVVAAEIPEYLKFLPHLDSVEFELKSSRDFVISLDTGAADVDHMKYEVEQGKINIIITPKQGRFSAKDVNFSGSMPDFDLIVTVDTGDMVQLGKLHEENRELFARIPLLNIDHHASNSKFGTYNYLETTFAATTQMLYPLILALEQERGEELIDEDVATLLLTGLITDTGSFQHSNTSPEAFEVAAELLDRGARQQEIIKHIFKTKSLATLKLWGRVLSKIQYDDTYKVVYSTITERDLQDTGAHSDDSGGIIDELMSNAPHAEVVLLLKEKAPGLASGSLRAPGHLADVSDIAGRIGGGGHKKAAGFRIKDKSMDEALAESLKVIRDYMQEKLDGDRSRTERMFPNLVTKPMSSIPTPSAGGEDLLLEDFRKRQDPEEEKIKEQSVRFFQDSDGQLKPEQASEQTVGDILSQLKRD